jgi:hypothetical protein
MIDNERWVVGRVATEDKRAVSKRLGKANRIPKLKHRGQLTKVSGETKVNPNAYLLAATGKCGKTAGLEMRLAKRGARNRSWNKTEEDAEIEGVEEDGAGRRHAISDRRIHPVFVSPLTL